MMPWITCMHWINQLMKSSGCVLQTYLHNPKCRFHFIIQVPLWPVGWLLRVGRATSESTGLDTLELDISKNKKPSIKKTDSCNETGRGQGRIVKGWGDACHMLNIYACTHRPPLALPPNALFGCCLTATHRSTWVPLMSSFPLHWAPAQPFITLHPSPQMLWSHFWNGSFIVKKGAIILYPSSEQVRELTQHPIIQ